MIIDDVSKKHTFELHYTEKAEKEEGETCADALNGAEKWRLLSEGWK